jgi:HSP20 family protein
MIEDENRFIIKAETPGFKAHEIKISAEPQRLIIEGQTEESLDEKSEKIVFSERRSNHFLRSFDLGAEIDPAQVAATLKDGLLEINMPKSSARQAVGVEVKSA